MDLGLAGRRAMVAASTRGIGAAMTRRLAGEGYAVLVHGRNPAGADEAAAEPEGHRRGG
ncbi:hypothetical protein [Streptomyces sp. NPDC059616]|uniref:hypothetical protein n=1 Tax=Streptomyces sp. NPDC059616 TaxID=3346886 RepID=UPI0036AD3286